MQQRKWREAMQMKENSRITAVGFRIILRAHAQIPSHSCKESQTLFALLPGLLSIKVQESTGWRWARGSLPCRSFPPSQPEVRDMHGLKRAFS
jgi:hypothetical protein